MLLALANWIAADVRAFNVFTYITLRSVLATMTALVISFVIGPRMIRKLTEYKIGQSVRDDGPQTHLIKAGTPTMGGALILVSIIVTTLLWADLRNRFVWVVLLVTLGFGTVGWIDDYRKVVQRNPKGLSAGKKLVLQSLIGLVAAIYLAFSVSAPSTSQFLQLFQAWLASGLSVDLSPKADLIVPFFKTVSYPLGVWGFIILSYCVIVGSSNAVNLTDGLDGLAIMPTVMVGAALGLFAYVAGRADFSTYLFMPHIPGAGELTVVCADRRSGARVSLVQRVSGRSVHGRRRCAGAGCRTGRDRGDREAGDRVVHHGRRVRRRDAVGDDPGRFVQADRQARVPHGADPPSLRIERLEGKSGRGSLLDHHDVVSSLWSVNVEATLNDTREPQLDLGEG